MTARNESGSSSGPPSARGSHIPKNPCVAQCLYQLARQQPLAVKPLSQRGNQGGETASTVEKILRDDLIHSDAPAYRAHMRPYPTPIRSSPPM